MAKKYKGKISVEVPQLLPVSGITAAAGASSVQSADGTVAPTEPKGTTTTSTGGLTFNNNNGAVTIDTKNSPDAAAPDITTPPTVEEAKTTTQAAYNKAAQNIDQDENNERTAAIADNTGNAAAMNLVNPWYATNQAQNSRYGNLNNKDYNSTLALSRLADQFNNVQWVAPGGRVGFTTNSSFGSAAPENPGYAQFNIDTQEMRQMRANEAVDAQARQEAASLQGDTQRMYLDSMNAKRNSDMAMTQLIGQADVNFGTFLQQAAINNTYNLASQAHWNQLMQDYAKQLDQHYNVKSANLLAACLKEAPVLANIMYSMFNAGMMDMDLATETTLYNEALKQLEGTSIYKKADRQTQYALRLEVYDMFFSTATHSMGRRARYAVGAGLGGFGFNSFSNADTAAKVDK